MIERILPLLAAVDKALAPWAAPGSRLDLVIMGRCALILGHDLVGATRDLDIVLGVLPAEAEEALLRQFGPGSGEAARHGLFLETVSSGLPPLPNDFRGRASEVPGSWRNIRPLVLEPHHLVVSKLSRYWPKDKEDIRFLADQGLLNFEDLHKAVEQALIFTPYDDPKYIDMKANLLCVEAYLKGIRTEL